MAARKSKARKTTSRRSARPGKRTQPGKRTRLARTPKRPAQKARSAKPKAPRGADLLGFARKIVRATQDPALFELRDLYAEGAVSREATGDVATGFAALEQKLARWEAMQDRTEWKPRKVFSDGNAICIEWDATVHLRDGKIVSERFYYNPMALAPQQG